MVKLRQIVLALLTILIVGSGTYTISWVLPGAREAHAANRSITLVGFAAGGWNATTSANPTITVQQGDMVSLRLSSGDGAAHLFLLDVDRDGTPNDDCPSVDPCSGFFSSSTPITLSFTANFPPGTYTYYCIVHPGSMLGSFVVKGGPDYTLSANPTSLALGQGNSTSSTVTVASLGGFTGVVSLSTGVSPGGPTASINPNSITVPSNGNGLATLTVSAATSTPAGKYNVTVTGTNGTTIRSVIIPTIVESVIGFRASMTFSGANASMSGRFLVNTAVRVLSGSTALTVINSTTGALIYSKTANVTMSFTQFGMSHFIEDIPTSPLWLGTSCAVNINTASVSCFLSRTPDMFHSGTITISEVTYILAHYGSSDALSNLSGTGVVNISDFGIIVQYYGAAVFLP